MFFALVCALLGLLQIVRPSFECRSVSLPLQVSLLQTCSSLFCGIYFVPGHQLTLEWCIYGTPTQQNWDENKLAYQKYKALNNTLKIIYFTVGITCISEPK